MTNIDAGLSTLLAIYHRKSVEAENAWRDYERLCDADVPQSIINAKGEQCEALSAEANKAYDRVNAAYRREFLVAGGPSGS